MPAKSKKQRLIAKVSSTDSKARVLAVCVSVILTSGPRLPKSGACINVEAEVSYVRFGDLLEISELFNALCEKWPKFSGDYLYPVPSPYPGILPVELYQYMPHIPKWSGQYGALRREMLEFVRDEAFRLDLLATKE